jgi:uroporphyrinogen-III decarboxylase
MSETDEVPQKGESMKTLTCPLSVAEREEFRLLFDRRLEKVKAKTADVFAFKEVKQPPFLVNGAPYWKFANEPETFPDDLFTDPAVMTNAQERMYYDQIKEIDDDFVPFLMPWFGTYVMPSAFGCRIEYPPKGDPIIDPRSRPVQTANDIKKLEIPNPEKDGLMPKILAYLAYMRHNSFLPVGITDFQGPLATANQVMGLEKLIYLMVDEPLAVHELMDKITEALIGWAKRQKEVTGEALTECVSDQCVYTGRHAGIFLSDDDAVLISPKLYKEFVIPYNSRILKAFGGGCLHYCGDATHQAENFLHTDGLRAINNSMMHKIGAFRELKSRVESRIVLFAVDLAPVDCEEYFSEMFADLSLKGLIVHWVYDPRWGMLKNGQLAPIQGDLHAGRRSVYEYLRRRFECASHSA